MISGTDMTAASSAAGNVLDAQTAKLLAQTRSGGLAGTGAPTEQAKIEKSSRDFESILLGSWLQQAEQSFATVPGGDGDEEDAGKDQFQGIAMQALAGSLTASGGIGIAKMIAKHLTQAAVHAIAGAQEAGEQTSTHAG